jgi:hypothetical protein
VFRLAQPIEVRLAEASQLTGGLVFQFVPDRPESPDPTARTRRGEKRSRNR